MSDFSIYSSKFFWDFKRRDNVDYNFEIIETLILASISHHSYEHREHFYKPIIIIMTSIIECILYDFLIRIPGATREGVPHINKQDIDLLKDTNVPHKLANINEVCKKYDILGKKNNSIYKKIQSFTNKRNRVHIQNVKNFQPADEDALWSASLVKECGKLLKDICLIMCNIYPRPDHIHLTYTIPRDVSFPEPWDNI